MRPIFGTATWPSPILPTKNRFHYGTPRSSRSKLTAPSRWSTYRLFFPCACRLTLVLLFGGVLILPRIGQAIWIAVVAAVYIRTTLVIAKREELLEKLNPTRESNKRPAWYDARERRIVISDSDGTWVLRADPNCERERTEITRQIPSSYPGEPRAQPRKRHRW